MGLPLKSDALYDIAIVWPVIHDCPKAPVLSGGRPVRLNAVPIEYKSTQRSCPNCGVRYLIKDVVATIGKGENACEFTLSGRLETEFDDADVRNAVMQQAIAQTQAMDQALVQTSTPSDVAAPPRDALGKKGDNNKPKP